MSYLIVEGDAHAQYQAQAHIEATDAAVGAVVATLAVVGSGRLGIALPELRDIVVVL